MSYKNLLYRVDDDVAQITLNQPQTLNALTTHFGEELLDALARGGREGKAILVRAAGRGFCSGASLGEGRFNLDDRERDVGARLETIYHPMISQMRMSPVPIVSAVNGPTAGIGCAIALAADLIVVAKSAYFYLSFASIGLVPDGGLAYLLTRAVGRPRASEIMLLGERVGALQAVEWGLVNRVVADDVLDSEAQQLAARLARGPRSLSMIRNLAWNALDEDFQSVLAGERVLQREAGRTNDFAEGVRAFMERRPAHFTGA